MIDVEKIIRYENGEMDWDETVEFFRGLVESGMILHLQGHYHRMANRLTEDGLI
jgi:hypothetical protein